MNKLGSFTLQKIIHKSIHGIVYSAEVSQAVYDLKPGEIVAIKVIYLDQGRDPHLELRIQREVELGMAVESPYVARTYGVERNTDELGRDCLVIIMERVVGKTLQELMDSGHKFDVHEVLDFARQTLLAMNEIHAMNAVHRDIKPGNLLITSGNRLVLLDLGIAKLIDQDISVTAQGTFMGTWAYSSPEQITNIQKIDHRSDYFSLGIIMFELFTGQNPFKVNNLALAVMAHMNFQPEDPGKYNKNLNPQCRKLILRLLAVRMDFRTANIKQILNLLESC